MRYFRYFLSILFGTLLSSSALAHAQAPWSSVLTPSRAINWGSAGLPATLPDGETTSNPWTPPTRAACTTAQAGTTVPIPSSASVATINSAITACAAADTAGSYLLLGSGTFTVSSTIALASNVTLRGAGPMSTILNVSSSAVVQLGTAITMSYCTVTAGSNYSQGSTTVICNSLTGTAPAAGDIGYLVQCDTGFSGGGWQQGAPYYGAWACITGSPSDNGAIYVCNYNTPCTQQTQAGVQRLRDSIILYF